MAWLSAASRRLVCCRGRFHDRRWWTEPRGGNDHIALLPEAKGSNPGCRRSGRLADQSEARTGPWLGYQLPAGGWSAAGAGSSTRPDAPCSHNPLTTPHLYYPSPRGQCGTPVADSGKTPCLVMSTQYTSDARHWGLLERYPPSIFLISRDLQDWAAEDGHSSIHRSQPWRTGQDRPRRLGIRTGPSTRCTAAQQQGDHSPG